MAWTVWENFRSWGLLFILDKSARIHVTNSTKPIPEEHWKSRDAVKQMENFNEMVQKRIGDNVKPEDAYFDGKYPDPPPALFECIDAFEEVLTNEIEASAPNIDDLLSPKECVVNKRTKIGKCKRKRKAENKDEVTELEEEFIPDGDIYNEYLNTQVMMDIDDHRLKCVVVKRTLDQQGAPIGKRNNNPVLDTRVYNMKLPDGSIEQYTANTIAECLYADIDDAGNTLATHTPY